MTKCRIAGRIVTNGHTLTAADTTIGPEACSQTGNAYQLVTGGTRSSSTPSSTAPASTPGDHLDALQFYAPGAKTDITIRHSSIDTRGTNNGDKGNAAIFLADNPGAGTITITDSRLAGGNFATSLYDATKGSGVIHRVTDNTYVRGSWQFGPCAWSNRVPFNGTEGLVFTGNRYDDRAPLLTC